MFSLSADKKNSYMFQNTETQISLRLRRVIVIFFAILVRLLLRKEQKLEIYVIAKHN